MDIANQWTKQSAVGPVVAKVLAWFAILCPARLDKHQLTSIRTYNLWPIMKRRLRRNAFSLPPSRSSIRSMTKQFSEKALICLLAQMKTCVVSFFALGDQQNEILFQLAMDRQYLKLEGPLNEPMSRNLEWEWSKRRHKRNIFGAWGVSLKCFTSGCATVHTNETSTVTFPLIPMPLPMPMPMPITKRILFQVPIPVQPCSKFDTFNCAWAEQNFPSHAPSHASLAVSFIV